MRLFLAASLLAIFAASVHAETFTVTRTTDSTDDCLPDNCSLRAAMTAAEANDPAGEPDVIVLPAGTYSLRTFGQLPYVRQPLRIQGAGSGQTLLKTEYRSLFTVGDGGNLALSGISLDSPFGGDGVGGSFAFETKEGSRASLDDVIVERGTVELRRQSSVQIRRSELRHYLAADGELLIEDSALFNLMMYFQAQQANATLRRVVVDSTTDPDPRPGAKPYIYQTMGTLRIEDSTITHSAIYQTMGALTIEDSTIAHSKAYLYDGAATLTMRRVYYRDNTGPIQTETAATVTIENSLFKGNAVRALYAAGGAEWNVTGSSFVNNSVDGNAGGAILIEDNTVLRIRNSTFSGNTFSIAAAANGARGAAIGYRHASGAHLIVVHSTIVEPAEMPAGTIGSAIGGHDANIAVDIANSIVRGSCGMDAHLLQNNSGDIESPGNTCGLDEEQNYVSVGSASLALGPLADNGGPTPAILPGTGSLAIDRAGTPQCLPTDQRVYARPGGARCDIGAVEADADDTLFADGFDG